MLDSFNRKINYLRISVTDLCNMRCQYCMPPEGVERMPHKNILSFEEICEFVRIAVEKGFDKIRLTGGEPLVRHDIISLVVMLAEIPKIKDFSMSTNGSLLKKYARPLKAAGLQRLNISLDTIDQNKFSEITRGGELSKVLEGIFSAINVGFTSIKLNCVITETVNEPDALAVAEFAKEHGLEVRFIRKMNFEKGKFWPVIGGDGGNCPLCNRLRLSSDGQLYPCLFNDKSYSIRELGYKKALDAAIKEKPESGHESNHKINILGG